MQCRKIQGQPADRSIGAGETTSRKGSKARRLACGATLTLGATVAPWLASTLPGGASPAGAVSTGSGQAGPSQGQIDATQTQVTQIEATIAHDQQRTDVLDNEYDAALQQESDLQAAMAVTAASITRTRARMTVDRRTLAHDAVNAYIFHTPQSHITSLFASPTDGADARSEYQNTSIGNVAAATAALKTQELRLAQAEARQHAQEQQAAQVASDAKSLAQQNAQTTASDQALLQQVKGTLAQEVAQAAQAQAAAAAAAAAAARNAASAAAAQAQAAAANEVASVVGSSTSPSAGSPSPSPAPSSAPPPAGNPPPAGSGGQAAVAAAQSQLGVPYVFGGESPGSGFDCSGLIQWAWAQAGVQLPRTSEDQWAALQGNQVSINDLQPGDLIFLLGSDPGPGGTPGHVVMYVGNGEVIQAPFTGTVVSYSPLFLNGFVGAARP